MEGERNFKAALQETVGFEISQTVDVVVRRRMAPSRYAKLHALVLCAKSSLIKTIN